MGLAGGDLPLACANVGESTFNTVRAHGAAELVRLTVTIGVN